MSNSIAPAKKDRLIFIDVMRGIAVLWMIETHVVDIVLSYTLKTGLFYGILNVSNGFVAVSFLFCAGAGFWLAAMKKTDDYKHFRAPLWVYIRRLLLILAIAYSLHMPSPSFLRLLTYNHQQWCVFMICDILQTIVYTSFFALLILIITPKIKYIPYIFGIIALAIFLLAPYILSLDSYNTLPVFFASFFSNKISNFTLFPWSGYFFSGVAVTAFFMQSENKRKVAMYFAGAGFILAVIFFNTQSIYYPFVQNWWLGSPGHSFFRVAGATCVFGFLYLIENYYKNSKVGEHLKIAGQESLFLYVSHLMIVYGSAMNFGFKYFIGNRLNFFTTFLIFAGIAIFCYAGAYVWHEYKAKDMKKARYIMYAVGIMLAITFFVNPG